MTKAEHDERLLVSRVYTRHDGKRQRISCFIAHVEDAKKQFHIYASLPETLYCAVFSPVDKRGTRRQLRRYVYCITPRRIIIKRSSTLFARYGS